MSTGSSDSEVSLAAALLSGSSTGSGSSTPTMMHQQVFVITDTNKFDDCTDIVSIHSTPFGALREMKRLALNEGGYYHQKQSEDEKYPWWDSEDSVLELDVWNVH